MPNFADILDQPASTIERPKPLPAGTYHAIVRGLPEYGESSNKKTPYARYVFEIIRGPMEIVDSETASEDEINTANESIGKTLRNDYYLTEDAFWRVKELAEHCGVDTDGLTRGQMMEACNGGQVLLTVRHEPARDGSDNIFARVAKTAALP